MRRKSKKEPLSVTSFRLPPDVKAFLHERAAADQRTMSFVLVEVLRLYINYLNEQKKQPKTQK
jgi:predicted transcriptional regulator